MAAIKKYNGSTWETTTARKYETATETITSGDTIYADGTAATISLKGNTTQSGTPSPSSPVDVNGVGERTENLFDKTTMTANTYLSNSDGQYLSSAGQSYSCIIKINPNTSYRVRTASQTMRIAFFTQYPQPNDTPTAYYNHDAMGSYVSRAFIETSGNTDTYMVVFCYNNSWEYADGKTVDEIMSTVMVSEGAEMDVPYEPYGYKIPISSGGVTTNIYLGSVQTVGRIKKLVLDGTEPVLDTTGYFAVRIYTQCRAWTGAICNYGTGVSGDNSGNYIWFSKNIFTQSTVNDFKAFLSQQYEGNAPVVVWYVLATAETDAINEPLMKIGNYADTLSNATAIPTTEGANSIAVDTTVQPSEFTATWTGWHDAEVKEKSENLWYEDYTNISSDIYYKPVYVGNYEIVTVSSTVPLTSQNFANLFALGGQQSSGASTGDNGVYSGRSMSVRPVGGYITIAYRNANGVNPQDHDTMVNEGRTALPYEPYWK